MKINIINEDGYGYGYVGYPDDISRYDNDPRSPRYNGPDYELTEYDDTIEVDVECIFKLDEQGSAYSESTKFYEGGRNSFGFVYTEEYSARVETFHIEYPVEQLLYDNAESIWEETNKKFKITATVTIPVILSTYYDIEDFGNHSNDEVEIDGDIQIDKLEITEVEQ